MEFLELQENEELPEDIIHDHLYEEEFDFFMEHALKFFMEGVEWSIMGFIKAYICLILSKMSNIGVKILGYMFFYLFEDDE